MRARYSGLDLFRLIAALMVIAIHTFPFGSITPVLDGLVTLTLFRVAVPFFFMITGFFLIGPYSIKTSYYNEKKLVIFLKKLTGIYLLAVIFYLPFSILNGTITTDISLVKVWKLLIFDGSFYHLWYFPGVLVGTLLVSSLLKFMRFHLVAGISIALYLIGLLGDSWYGIIKGVPFLVSFYDVIFNLTEMTRNGLFFTPLFLVLGAYLYRNKDNLQREKNEYHIFLIITLVMLVIESFFLHQVFTVRHDSMYLLLPSVMYFLFILLLQWQPKITVAKASDLALMMYLSHPLVIMVVHFLSNKIAFIKFSLIYYGLVVIGSFVLSKVILNVRGRLKKPSLKNSSFRAEKELSSEALKHNIQEITSLIPEKTNIIGVVKANAYGADMVQYAKLLAAENICFLAVATIDEGIKLRKAMIAGDILILGYTDIKRYKELVKYDLIQSIGNQEYARILSRKKAVVRCHLQIDTGMHRLGMAPEVEQIASLYRLPYLKIEGIYSHLGSSDSLEEIAVNRTEEQLHIYCQLLNQLKEKEIPYGVTHIQSSYGILNYPEYQFDYVRCGIILYGLLSSDEPVKNKLLLKPTVKVKAKLISKQWVNSGEYIGYGTETRLRKETLVGVVSIGYADGLPRSLSNQEFGVEYKDYYLPQIGRICMDMFLVDLSQVSQIEINDEITVISDFKAIACMDDTITNETMSQLGSRLSATVV